MKYRNTPKPQMSLWLQNELIIDNFAGGGGASTGIETAMGRPVDIAINHDPVALDVHTINHPHTRHYAEDIRDIDPRKITKGKPVALAWFSPDCRHHSRAKGGKPKKKSIRGLAWQVMKYAAMPNKPRVIMLENVGEFEDWGPLKKNGQPDKTRLGITFKSFCRNLEKRGYQVEHRILHAHHYGAPTIRKRLFLIARSDGQPIIWPQKTHGPTLKPYRTAAECIDWSIPCPSIFERKKPLADNTLRRIAKGIQKFVIDSPNPFLIQVAHYSKNATPRAIDLSTPLNTITDYPKGGSFALVTPFVAHLNHTAKNYQHFRGQSLEQPVNTVTQSPGMALVAPVIARQFGTGVGHRLDEPTRTVMPHGGGKNQLITAFLAKHYTGVTGSDLKEPLHTVTAKDHHSLVTAFLIKYYGTNIGHSLNDPLQTVTAKDRFGLVTVLGEQYRIVDIGMRMLASTELYKAQGFPADYIFDRGTNDKPIPKTKQVAMCGNSVCPGVAEALVRANMIEQSVLAKGVAA